jgi:3-hydroxyisobutyrate dehydrogenase-like beta-hydroxyacid dehydrogenase
MNIGFIGLGAMGQGIVPRLINAREEWHNNRTWCFPS